jgi:hypothetical protein
VRQPVVPEEPVERRQPLRFSILRDILIAPARAFADILATRSWLPAYFVYLIAGFVYLASIAPAITHLASMLAGATHKTPAQAADAARAYVAQAALYNSIQPLLIWGLTAMTFTAVARFKKQATPFGAFFALAAAASVPSALGGIIDALGTRLHPPTSYQSIKALLTAVPDNLAMLASAANDHEVSFLANFGVFDLWSTMLLAYGLVAFTGAKITTALALSFFLDIVFALVFSAQ